MKREEWEGQAPERRWRLRSVVLDVRDGARDRCRVRDRGAVDTIAVGRAWASATSPRVTRGIASRHAPTAERSHHRRVSYDEEFVALCDEHGVA